MSGSSAIADLSSDAVFGVWDANSRADVAAWTAHWQSWPAREIHAHPAYVGGLSEGQNSRAYCAWDRSPRGAVLPVFSPRSLDRAVLEGGTGPTDRSDHAVWLRWPVLLAGWRCFPQRTSRESPGGGR